ncbi:diphthamide biosynthesis protein [Methanococcus aeolicus Nankai-3]|uniref:2-(3-amino-3-carboxypropyl)histidine synthase n=1 Tax=Methanococcus aeolicus (strain ATCC BAA-1280 / DSM 17508 / OCM 812 / Nankai-3) TaxID=419665 RepID=A6UVG4_META3|nr:diphthamide biosynthesis enzyme Dph2 [Methanococcus aeolicus]ABR56486.1 diphthamide biosynthesis protein [Methanococcus aeolicus Nankai-3]
MWNLETDRVIKEIEKSNGKNIVFHAPEGLKLAVEKEIEKINDYFNSTKNLIMWGAPCYGACDLCDHELKYNNIDLIIHYGHEELPYAKPDIPTIFIHCYYIYDEIEQNNILNKIDEYLQNNPNTIITTTIQFKELLKKYNPNIILGCRANISNKPKSELEQGTEKETENSKILYIGTGRFHPLMLCYKFKKSVNLFNPTSKEFSAISEEEVNKFIKKRIGAISKLLINPPKKIGVVLSTKKGQNRINVYNKIINLLKDNNIEYMPIILNNASPDNLFYDVSAYIICACPRIVLDDYLNYNKTLLTPKEFEMYIKKDFEYVFDEILFDDFEP